MAVILVMVPGLTFAVLAFSSARRALEDAIGRQLAEEAREAAEAIDDLVKQQQDTLRTLVSQDLMRELQVGDVDKRITQVLLAVKGTDSAYLDLLCANSAGVVIASTSPHLMSTRQTDQAWFAETQRGDPAVFAPPHADSGLAPFLTIAAPVDDPDSPGRIIGACATRVALVRVGEITDRIRRDIAELGAEVDVLILDRGGTAITGSWSSTHEELRGRNVRSMGWDVASLPPQPTRGFAVDSVPAALIGYAVPKAVPFWTVVTLQPRNEPLAPIARLQRQWLLILASILLGASAIAVVSGNRIVRPLSRLATAIRAVASTGDIPRPVPVETRDELGEVAEAFNEMTQRLAKAQKDLFHAARMATLGELAAGITHEIRTPLGVLRTSAQMLLRSDDHADPEKRELKEIMIEEVDRLERVVAGLLELARPPQLRCETVALREILKRVFQFVEPEAHGHGVILRLEPEPPVPVLAWCDTDQTYRVALNLVINAIQVLGSRGTITLRAFHRDGEPCFAVSDDGPGIAPDLRNDIFKPFFTMRQGGIGLGLALAERIVHDHGGGIEVESHPGRGATFVIRLRHSPEAS